jgi:TetR/AcrR family transcriptional regulator, transcriptional repressor for nem operon
MSVLNTNPAHAMTDKPTRDRIVEAADRLFYQQGYEQTSFTHIAEAVGITRGNFYHHFKSKDDILDAVIGARLAATAGMLARWEEQGGGPQGRLLCFIDMLVRNRAQIVHYGCPVGTLCTEMAKLRHPSRDGANQLFVLFRTWLRRQFELLGRGGEADQLAMHLLARSQGVATLAQAFHDEGFIHKEVDAMRDWLKGVCTCLS